MLLPLKLNIAERLKQAKVATDGKFADFVEKTYFDEKLKNNNKKVTSHKTKHIEGEKTLNDLS